MNYLKSIVLKVLPLYPPPKGELYPIKLWVKLGFQFALSYLFCSGQKINDFLYSPFGGGVRGRINNIHIHP
jgi:hypothetical protein